MCGENCNIKQRVNLAICMLHDYVHAKYLEDCELMRFIFIAYMLYIMLRKVSSFWNYYGRLYNLYYKAHNIILFSVSNTNTTPLT